MTAAAILRAQVQDRVGAAFYAVSCLDAAERAAFVERFNRTFGQCTPPLSIEFKEPTK